MPRIERNRYLLVVPLLASDAADVLTDFSARRPEVWRETSHPRVFRSTRWATHGPGH